METVLSNYPIANVSGLWYLCRYCIWCSIFSLVKLKSTLASRQDLELILDSYLSMPALWKLNHPWHEIWTLRENYSKKFNQLTGQELRFDKRKIHTKDSQWALSYLNQPLTSMILRNHSFTVRINEGTRKVPCNKD